MKVFTFEIILVFLSGCVSPAQHFNETAQILGLKAELIYSSQFQHKIYSTTSSLESGLLHVYLDGDGTPWGKNRWIAEDPTARNPLILRLMKQDNKTSILLGRPCYYGLNKSLGCHNKYWTSHRYSIEVVESMIFVLNAWIKKHTFNHIVLIGYSGGGSLAMLMADEINGIKKVVTVAANLNVVTWSEFHGYLGLKNSLNPAEHRLMNASIEQIHFSGQEDEVVPAFIIKEYAKSQKNTSYYEFSKQGHACCWEEVWLDLLAIIENE